MKNRLGVSLNEIDTVGCIKKLHQPCLEIALRDTMDKMDKIIEEWRALSKETGCEPCPIDVDLTRVTIGHGDRDGSSRQFGLNRFLKLVPPLD